ncbi:MAG: hypothetical protein LDL19_03720 [Thiobacillus sp.]|nr:hypothetical protein [Thiobacillus sp.]
MRASFKALLTLCLMLALPLQGYAAATMLSCAFGHGSAPPAVETAPSCHTTETPDAPPARHDCAHCAVCLHATALPIPMVAALPEAQSVRDYASVPATVLASHVPDGPERPPRSDLA